MNSNGAPHMLPYDILYNIFTHGLRNTQRTSPVDRRSYLLAISQVCMSWRRAAVDSKLLWSHVDFGRAAEEWPLQVLWIARTNGAPILDICIYRELRDDPFIRRSMRTFKSIFRLLAPMSAQWRSFEVLWIPPKLERVVFQRLFELPLPNLQNLTIKSSRAVNSVSTRWKALDKMPALPALQCIDFRTFPAPWSSALFRNLVIAKIEDPSISALSEPTVAAIIYTFFAASPHLQEFRLDSDFGAPSERRIFKPSKPDSVLVMEKLERMMIVTRPGNVMEHLLPWVCFPALHSCQVEFNPLDQIPKSTLHTIALNRPLPAMSGFTCIGAQASDIWPALGGLAGLKTLRISRTDFSKAERGKRHLMFGDACPQLEELYFHSCTSVVLAEVVEIVKARPSLRRVGIEYCRTRSTGASLKALRSIPRLVLVMFPELLGS